jgi:hypothetical protein
MMDIHFSCDGHHFVAPEESSVPFTVGDVETNERRRALSVQGQPVTVLSLGSKVLPAPDKLKSQLQALLEHDDVTQPGFLKMVLVSGPDPNACISQEDRKYYNDHGFELAVIITALPVPTGPYYVFASQLRQIFRLYEDPFDAFALGMICRGSSNQE